MDLTSTSKLPDDSTRRPATSRIRWAAIGAAVAVTLGAGGGFGLARAAQNSGERATYTPISPCRLTDTRATNQIGPRNTPIGADETYTIAARGAQGQCDATDLPADATALVLNVTALGATSQSFLTFWPDGNRPEAASLNPSVGAPPIPNAVTTQLAGDGSFKLYNERGTVNVVIDVSGYYTDHNHDDRYPLKGDVYTKTESDAQYPSRNDVYTKTESDAQYPSKNDVYTKTESDAQYPSKNDVYTKTESDGRYFDRATVTGLIAIAGLRNGTVSVPAQEFRLRKSGGLWDMEGGGILIPTAETTSVLEAPVLLPDGVDLGELRATVLDNSLTTNLRVELVKYDDSGVRTVIGTTASVGVEGFTYTEWVSAALIGEAADNDKFSYVIEASTRLSSTGASTSWPDTAIRLLKVEIQYAD